MKLYTEDQVRQALWQTEHPFSDGKHVDEIIDSLTPIQLPSDDEIEEFSHTKYMEVEDSRWFEPLKVGAKWMRDKIQGGNK